MRWVWIIALFCIAGAARAEMDASEYEVRKSVQSDAEREALRRRIEADKETDRIREQAEAERRAAEAERRRQELEARPYPVRLAEARCTECHPAAQFEGKHHGWVGWSLVVARMRFLNGAVISGHEAAIIIPHLVAEQGDPREDAAWGAGLFILLIGSALTGQRLCRYHRGKIEGGGCSGDNS